MQLEGKLMKASSKREVRLAHHICSLNRQGLRVWQHPSPSLLSSLLLLLLSSSSSLSLFTIVIIIIYYYYSYYYHYYHYYYHHDAGPIRALAYTVTLQLLVDY